MSLTGSVAAMMSISEEVAAEMLTPQPWSDFPGLIAHLLANGFTRNPCSDACPDKDVAEHEHLHGPDGDLIVWADGRWSGWDLTQPARCLYPVYCPVPKRQEQRAGYRVTYR